MDLTVSYPEHDKENINCQNMTAVIPPKRKIEKKSLAKRYKNGKTV